MISDRCLVVSLLTLAYSQRYLHPLSPTQVFLRQWILDKSVCSLKQIISALTQLEKINLVEKEAGLYRLAVLPIQLKQLQKRQAYSNLKYQEAERVKRFIQKLPWVTGLALTGSVANNTAWLDDDIDFLLVTKKNRLWLTRIIVIIFAWAKGKRRSFAGEEPRSWCFNLWLEEHSLSVPEYKRSLYTAYEVCQADWLMSRAGVAENFLLSNRWAGRRLPVFFVWRWQQLDRIKTSQVSVFTQLASAITSPLLDFLNLWSYAFQLWYMRAHRTTELIDLSHAYFHPNQ